MGNSLGHNLVITSFGESHGPYIGLVLDGFPPKISIDLEWIAKDLSRRRPGQSSISTQRNESDSFQIISGIFEGKSTGAPITILIPNEDQRPTDYDAIKDIYRPGHADKVYDLKYGNRDHRGGGRSSARITAAWVAAGTLAKMLLKDWHGCQVQSVVSAVHHLRVNDIFSLDWTNSESNPMRCPDARMAEKMIELVEQVKLEGDSVGGLIATKVTNCPNSLGEPVFDKLNADLAKAMFSINAVKGVSFGLGFESTLLKGSEYNDDALSESNKEGGITGGISNGNNIEFITAFKPVSSISKTQSVQTKDGQIKEHSISGRHDPCVLPRAVPIVEAMTAICLADHVLMNLKYKK